MALEWALAFIGLGAFAGFMAGLLGVGGGGIMVPLLTTIFLAMSIEPVNGCIWHWALPWPPLSPPRFPVCVRTMPTAQCCGTSSSVWHWQ
ncbi:hypothetical protein [Alkanindiges illinoisensis]|uniref:hypothetical protein n=1 Tax=Alkanindiges illinoisensis TaxID=197183 RepID=UPI00196A4BF2|nr:hypothetical protein [Alkanindiges illinoisensis]